MVDNPRIEELRRRVEKDPASIAFAQLAEEYRRAGSYEEAVATCRTGLATHPSYLSARVTLGRALIELNGLEEAQAELELVLQHAPENLAAIRGLAEIHHRRGDLDQALGFYKSAMEIARHDPDLEQTVAEISRAVKPGHAPVSDGLSFEEATAEFLDSFSQSAPHSPDLDSELEPEGPERSHMPGSNPAFSYAAESESGFQTEPELAMAGNPALPSLERFLVAIHTYRQRRAV